MQNSDLIIKMHQNQQYSQLKCVIGCYEQPLTTPDKVYITHSPKGNLLFIVSHKDRQQIASILSINHTPK